MQAAEGDGEKPSTSDVVQSSQDDDMGDNSVTSNEAEPKKKDENQLLKVGKRVPGKTCFHSGSELSRVATA